MRKWLFFLFPVLAYGQTPVVHSSSWESLPGDYINTASNQVIVIGRTPKQLFVLDESNHQLRGLNKIDESTWAAGSTVISTGLNQQFEFTGDHLKISEAGKEPVVAVRKKLYTENEITFSNNQGIRLGGTLFIPLKPSGKGMVLVHGSGPQDRNGSNSCIRFLADDLCRRGITVLTYDKQGIGSSQGDWSKMNFTQLADDGIAAMTYLKTLKKLNLSKIGMGGYSQAGWIMARVIQKQPDVDFILALSTAGSAITVAEQNIYDVKTQMQCAGKYSPQQIELIHKQQDLFFSFINSRQKGDELNELTSTIAKDSVLKEWKYPSVNEIDFNDKSQWFNALEVGFNPLPVWRKFKHPVLVVLAEFDDSTPSLLVKQRITGLNNSQIRVSYIKKAQHIGLVTGSVCNAKAGVLRQISPDYFNAIHHWIDHL